MKSSIAQETSLHDLTRLSACFPPPKNAHTQHTTANQQRTKKTDQDPQHMKSSFLPENKLLSGRPKPAAQTDSNEDQSDDQHKKHEDTSNPKVSV
jgi:hypothetical protein